MAPPDPGGDVAGNADGGPAVVVVGEALVDLVVAAARGTLAATPGGAPYNVARACARLDGPVALVAAVSTDPFGRRLLADLARDGVGTTFVQPTDAPTTLAVADLDDTGGATYRFYLEGTSAARLTAVPLPATTRVVVAGGLGLAVEGAASAVERMVLDTRDGVLVLVDLNCRPDAVADRDRYLERLERVLGRADVVKASVEDLGYTDPDAEPVAVASRLLTRPTGRTRAVLVTAGGRPTTIVTACAARTVPVAETPVVDTIGAGDTFTAAFLTWWLAHDLTVAHLTDPDAVAVAVRAAHEAAAVVVGRRGADPPHRSDLPPGWCP